MSYNTPPRFTTSGLAVRPAARQAWSVKSPDPPFLPHLAVGGGQIRAHNLSQGYSPHVKEHEVSRTYVPLTSCSIQNNPRLLDYVLSGCDEIFPYQETNGMSEKATNSGPCRQPIFHTIILFMPRKRNRTGTRSHRNICSYDFVLLTKQSPSVRLRVSGCDEDFSISEDNGMSEKIENYFRVRIRHNDPCRAEKTGCQVIRGQLRPFSAIVHKVHHTYVRITSCYIQNNPLLLEYPYLAMIKIPPHHKTITRGTFCLPVRKGKSATSSILA